MSDYQLRYKIISFFQDIDIKGFRRFADVLPKWLIPSPKSACIIKTLHGFNLIVDPITDEGVERSIYYTGTYEKGSLYVMKSILKQGDVFIDIGANIGLMSIFAATIVKDEGKVIAFEPNPVTREIFWKNVNLNSFSNIEISPFAIGSKNESAIIYDRWDSNRGSASLIKPNVESGSYSIQTIKLVDYVGIKKKIRLIKIDVEGFELEVLRGANEILMPSDSPILIVECSQARENLFGEDVGLIYDQLKNSHYRIFKSKGGKERVSKLIEIRSKADLPKHDNIYCFKNIHLHSISTDLFESVPEV